jgi:methanogenic corrinoid protein MtbC1
MNPVVDRFETALLHLNRVAAQEILAEAGAMMTAAELAGNVVAPALERLGASWQNGDVALSQIYMSGRICEELLEVILPPAAPSHSSSARIAITVLHDYHMLGKRIVGSVLRCSGLDLLDYGRTHVDGLVDRVVSDGIRVLLISTLMYPSALEVKAVRAQLDVAAPEVKILVGGAPFNLDAQLWREVGADAMGRDATEAVALVNQMMGMGERPA